MDHPSTLEDRVVTLEREVGRLSARLAAVERPTPVAAGGEAVEGSAIEAAAAAGVARLEGVPALVGRTCLVLGGAFLVRSLTEAGTLSSGIGVSVGVLYALGWLVLADRAAAAGRHLSGAFHALASALIVYPLLVEATTRFGLVAPRPAAVLLALATALGLAVAWRRAFRTVGWITVLAALGTGMVLLFRTRAVTPFVIYLLALAVASLVFAYGRGWRGQRWLVAMSLDVVVAMLGALLLVGRTPPPWLGIGPVLLAQLGLVVVYLGAFVLRLLFQERDVTPFAVLQTCLVLLIGFEGALALAQGGARQAIAAGALAAGVLLHVGLARRSERRAGHGVAVAYFSSLATFLAAESLRPLLPASVYPALWAAAAAAVAALALAGRRPVLQAHGALLATAAALASGLLLVSLDALATAARAAWREPTTTTGIVLLFAVATALLLYRGAPREGPQRLAAAARLLALAVALSGLGGLVIRLVAEPLAGAPGEAADPGRLAIVRSAVLAGSAILLALARSLGGRPELSKFAALLLAAGGFKLLIEDLRVGSAGTLVFSLALYGGALILVPALARRARGVAGEPPAAAPPGPPA